MICKTLLESLYHSSLPFTYYLFFHTYLNQMSQPVVGDLALLPVKSSNIFLWTIKGTLFNLSLDFSRDNAFQLSGFRLCWHSISQLVLPVISPWSLFLSSSAMLSFLVGGVKKTTMEIKYHFHKLKRSTSSHSAGSSNNSKIVL